LNEFDDRRVINILAGSFIGFGHSLIVQEVKIDVFTGEAFQRLRGGLCILADKRGKLRLFNDDRVYSQPGLKADFV